MDKASKLVAESRNVKGSSSARRLRRDGHLPGKINCEDGKCRLVQLNRHAFEMMLRHHTSENLLFDIEIDKEKPLKVLLKEVQHDPVVGTVIHVDFLEVSMTKKMRVRIPLILTGEPVGVSQEGGVLEQILRELEVECLPGDLIEIIEVDVAALKLHEILPVEKLIVDPKLTVLTDKKLAVAGVMEPRKEEEVTPEAGAAVPGAEEPELIAKEKKEGEEGEEGEEAEGAEKGKKKEEPKAKDGAKTKEEPAKKDDGKKKEAAGKKPEAKAGK